MFDQEHLDRLADRQSAARRSPLPMAWRWAGPPVSMSSTQTSRSLEKNIINDTLTFDLAAWTPTNCQGTCSGPTTPLNSRPEEESQRQACCPPEA
ncbi:MAG: hypothetical protein U0792_09405 [Gemmataceae bacterium]